MIVDCRPYMQPQVQTIGLRVVDGLVEACSRADGGVLVTVVAHDYRMSLRVAQRVGNRVQRIMDDKGVDLAVGITIWKQEAHQKLEARMAGGMV